MANGKADFRVHVGWRRHPKTLKLKRILGADGPLALLTLWGYAAEHHPDGDLGTLSTDDIADAAEWDGKQSAEEFVATLYALRWLDEGGLLHDWAEEQPWVANQAARSVAAREAANRRWDDARMRLVCDPHADRNAIRNAIRNAPSPSPSPYPKSKNTEGPPALFPEAGKVEVLNPLAEAWNRATQGTKLPKVHIVSAARTRHIRERLKEADVATWERAYRLIAADRWMNGGNDRGWVASFEYALRPEKSITWLEKARAAPAAAQPRTEAEEAADAEERRRRTQELFQRRTQA